MTTVILWIKKIFKLILVLFLVFAGFVLLVVFLKFTEIEERMKSGDTNYQDYYSSQIEDENGQNKDREEINDLIRGENNNYSLGPEEAKVTIVEFSDFSCSYCKQSFPKIREISLLYKDDVRYIFRDLPIVSSHSINLAMGARCAGEQGLFWSMHDRLFLDQGISTREEILLSAKKIGSDMDKFVECYDTERYLTDIKKDHADAQALEVDKYGTPVWFVNEQLVVGDIPEEIFKDLIEKIIK